MRRAAGRAWSWRSLPCHGDFYDEQLVVSDEGLAILDLDDAAMSEPAVDVANLLAHLDLLALRAPARRRAVDGCAEAFAARYRELDARLDDALVELLRGATFLRLAGIHVGRADGVRLAPLLIAACELALRRVPIPSRTHRAVA